MSEIDDLVSKIMSQMGSDSTTNVDAASTTQVSQNSNEKITDRKSVV